MSGNIREGTFDRAVAEALQERDDNPEHEVWITSLAFEWKAVESQLFY